MALGKIKQLKTREFEEILNKNGFILVRSKGDHKIYKRTVEEQKETVVVNLNLNQMVARRLIKQHKLKL